MQLVLVSADLMLVSVAQGSADRHGVNLLVASTAEAALQQIAAAPTAAIIIDLRLPGLDVAEFVPDIRRLSAADAVVLACAPHVHREALAAATAAGCDEIITRGEFDRRVDDLLARLTASPAHRPGPG